MTRPLLLGLLVLALATAAGAFLIANSRVGFVFVRERIGGPWGNIRVDADPVFGVTDPTGVARDLIGRWNAVPEAGQVFTTVSTGGSYNGANVMTAFGVFTDANQEIAFDTDGSIMTAFGIGPGVLGVTLKSVNVNTGQLLDFLIVVNTSSAALSDPGATREQLFRTTLLHELGHAVGLAHSPVGMANQTTFGLDVASPAKVATMYPFRVPIAPQEGGTLELDDRAGLTRNYPLLTSGLGSISGTVQGLSGAAVNEIAVRAVNVVTGDQAGALSNADATNQGRFTIPHLPPGRYRVLIETVNGRGNVTGTALTSGAGSLGSNPFVMAADEFWQPGDTYDPANDAPTTAASVEVRAGDDTGSIDFVLNATPLFDGLGVADTFSTSSPRIPGATTGQHFANFYVFQGSAGQIATITAQGNVGPQLRLLRPSDFAEIATDFPLFGSLATIPFTLPETGVYTVVVSARSTTGAGNGGAGSYTVGVTGSGLGLPPPAAPQPASATLGAADRGDQDFGGPICALPVLQVRVDAPSQEQLWVDQLRVRASGSGDDALDVTNVRVVRDFNGNGNWDIGEPVLGSGTFDADDGQAAIPLSLTLPAGEGADLLVVYDIALQSVAPPQTSWVLWLPLALLLPLVRRRGALVLVLAVLPLACSGGDDPGPPACNFAFNPNGAVADFAARVDPGDILAFTPTTAGPQSLPAASIQSGTLRVSAG